MLTLLENLVSIPVLVLMWLENGRRLVSASWQEDVGVVERLSEGRRSAWNLLAKHSCVSSGGAAAIALPQEPWS